MKILKLASTSWFMYFLVLVALVFCSISTLVLLTEDVQQHMQDALTDTHKLLLGRVEDRLQLLTLANASVSNIGRLLSSKYNQDSSSFSVIESKVAPWLFMAFRTASWVYQISYVSSDGLILSYIREGDQILCMFSNTSFSSNSPTANQWYIQPINLNTGERYDNAIVTDSSNYTGSKWFNDSLNSSSEHGSWGLGWDKAKTPMFLFTSQVAKRGVVSLGVAVKDVVDYVLDTDIHGGNLYLVTYNGHLLSQTGLFNVNYGMGGVLITTHLLNQNGNASVESFDNISCPIYSHNNTSIGYLTANHLNIQEGKHDFSCSFLNVAGVRLVSLISLPHNTVGNLLLEMKIIIVLLLLILIIGLVIGAFIVLQVIRGLQVQEIFLRANLIKQKEAVQQAERKSMNKSSAFANASHDVRNSLAGITGLIELCRNDVPANSDLDRNLVQMNICAEKLLGILNSILDTSKVEAGKMQLEEVEFDMAQVLEESIDIFHVVALKKAVEIIWDPCDCSVFGASNVKGDCKRFKQILDNLLANAVKFTSEGYIVIRAWSNKPKMQNLKLSPKHGFSNFKFIYYISNCFSRNEEIYTNAHSQLQLDPNSIEFIFEIDDTGVGIPNEKRASIFENYVQVRGSSAGGHEGTGLGLGIVQSFVRLMGGEISIQEKESGERGTCFRFNIFLKPADISSSDSKREAIDNIQMSRHLHKQDPCSSSVDNIEEHSTIQSNDPAMVFTKGIEIEGIHALLFLRSEETRKIVKRWMVRLGIKVLEVYEGELLSTTFETIVGNLNAYGKFESASSSILLNKTTLQKSNIENEVLANSYNKDEQSLPVTFKDVHKKTGFKGIPTYLVIIIDLSCENFEEICLAMKAFAKSNPNIQYKVVWLTNPNSPRIDLRTNGEAPCDLILRKPLHGSRLYSLLRLMQEFGEKKNGPTEITSSKVDEKPCSYPLPTNTIAHTRARYRCNEINEKSLAGQNILLVEDAPVLRHLASTMLSRLGANVESSENGLEALKLVKKALQEASHAQDGNNNIQKHFRYNVILMDCEMPIMNGYDATWKVRQEEKQYGYHIPIIALTGHATPDEKKKTLQSGMDFHLTKPLQADKLLEAIYSVCQMEHF